MVSVRSIPVFVATAVAALVGLVVWSIRRIQKAGALGITADDWAGSMLVWLLVLAAFVAGVFISYALLEP